MQFQGEKNPPVRQAKGETHQPVKACHALARLGLSFCPLSWVGCLFSLQVLWGCTKASSRSLPDPKSQELLLTIMQGMELWVSRDNAQKGNNVESHKAFLS